MAYRSPIEFDSSRLISCLYALIIEVIVADELSKGLVSAQSHEFELLIIPGIHLKRPHKREINSQVAMDGCTVQANERPIIDTSPLGALGTYTRVSMLLG